MKISKVSGNCAERKKWFYFLQLHKYAISINIKEISSSKKMIILMI